MAFFRDSSDRKMYSKKFSHVKSEKIWLLEESVAAVADCVESIIIHETRQLS